MTSKKHSGRVEKVRPDDQSTRFRQAAKEVGADESEATFEEKLRKIANAKPDGQPKPSGKSK